MKKAVVIIIIILAVGGGVYALTANKDKKDQDNTSSTSTTGQNQPVEQPLANQTTTEKTITYTDEGFSPNELTVKKGTTVKIINNSSMQLEFSSDDHPTHTKDPELNQGITAPGESTIITLQTVGSHGYHNHLNASDTGTLIVTE